MTKLFASLWFTLLTVALIAQPQDNPTTQELDTINQVTSIVEVEPYVPEKGIFTHMTAHAGAGALDLDWVLDW